MQPDIFQTNISERASCSSGRRLAGTDLISVLYGHLKHRRSDRVSVLLMIAPANSFKLWVILDAD